MRAFEFLTEDPKIKSQVLRSLSKMPDDTPIFSDVYKMLVGGPLSTRIENYINNRQDQDAIKAMKWLVQNIPTVGSAQEVKAFLNNFQTPDYDYVDTKKLAPNNGMEAPADLGILVDDPFAQKLFDKIFQEFQGKGDAGPGEAALAIMSPNITYGSPGDIVVAGKKVEVKASRGSGKAGRIWDMPLNQKPMVDILSQLNITNFTVMQGTQPFPDDNLKDDFIREACICWFGKPIPSLQKSFGTDAFKDQWQSLVFDTYKAHGGWEGMLALGVKTYQYITTGQQFAQDMKKANQGSICRATAKQSRELAPQVYIA